MNKQVIDNEHGSTLIISLLILLVLVVLAMGSIQSTTINVSTTGSYKLSKMAYYAAEAGLDMAVGDIVQAFKNLDVYTESGGYITLNDFNGYDVKYKIENPLSRYLYQSVVGNSTVFHYAYTYEIEAKAESTTGRSSETLNETVRILETPLVQYFIFYGGDGNAADLEWLPGPSMTSWGRVHSNGDIYIGVGGSNTLAFRNYDESLNLSPHSITAVGSILRKRKNDGSATGGTVRVKISSTGTTFTPTEDITAGITSANEATEETRFNDYVLVNEEPRSSINQQSLERNSFYEQRAEDPQRPTVDGIKIVGQGPVGVGGIEVFVSRPSYTDVTTLVANGEVAVGVPATVGPPIIQETLGVFTDVREGDAVDLTDIDLNLLEQWYVDYLDYQDNSFIDGGPATNYLAGDGILIYASRSPDASFTNSGDPLQAIRLVPSAVPQLLDETTLATDNPIYIEGNFNTITTRGVAIISDAINILSNNWAANPACNATKAAVTTINAAFFGGNVPTPGFGVGPYSGGLENYPRFHENWTGVNANINGSFINLWSSAQATGTWVYGCPRYTAPIRTWGWDVNFQDPQFWPPFLPSSFSVERAGFIE